MKFNASGSSASVEFYQKHLFIFLAKQLKNSSLINGIERKDPQIAPAIATRTAERNWDAEIDGFSFTLGSLQK